MTSARKRAAAATLAVVCYAVFAALWGLGSYPLIDPDEPRYAQSAREMIARPDYLVPHLNGEARLNKPPLVYWLQIASYGALGGPGEFAARFPSALAALAMGGIVFLFARRFFGAAAGALCVPVLFSMPLFAAVTHLATTDATMTAFLAAALYSWWRMRETGGPAGWTLASWVMLALAALAKGPVAVVLYVLVIVAFTALRGEWLALKRTFRPAAIVVFLAIVLPWPAAVLVERPDVAQLWYHETIARFLSGVDHKGYLLQPLGLVIAGTLPWFFLVRLPAGRGIREKAAALLADEKRLFLFVWVAVAVVFFGICRTQLPSYLLPAVPPVAVMAAGVLARAVSGASLSRAPIARAAIAASALALCAVGYAVFKGRLSGGAIIVIGLVTSAGTSIMAALLFSGRVRAATAVLVALVAGVTALATPLAMSEVAATRSLRTMAENWRDEIIACDELYFQGPIHSRMGLVYYSSRYVTCIRTNAQYLEVLSSPRRVGIIQFAKTFDESLRRKDYRPSHRLAGTCRVGRDEYVLVTNFPRPPVQAVVPPGMMAPPLREVLPAVGR